MYHPQKKNLFLSIILHLNNNVFLKFHPNFFLIKDQDTRNTLFRGTCRHGLYPLPSSSATKQAFGINKVSIDRWHNCLGHPAIPIVERVLKNRKLPYYYDSNENSVCDTCQRAKSHQFPYPKSTSVNHPLELVFSYVWGVCT